MSIRLFRISNIFSWSVAIFLGSLLFWVSQSVQRAEDDLSRYGKMVNLELEAIRVLEAEWDYLGSPLRLEGLASGYLPVDDVSPSSVARQVSDIPDFEVPVIPSIKPVPVSAVSEKSRKGAESKSAPSKEKNIIQNIDRHNFNSLLEDLSDGGAL